MVNQVRSQHSNSAKSHANSNAPARGRSRHTDTSQQSQKGSNSDDQNWDFFSPPQADTYVNWDFFFSLLGGADFWKTLGIGMDPGEFLNSLGIQNDGEYSNGGY
jgi:hypothetical protein